MGELNSSALTHHLHLQRRTMVQFRQGDVSQPAENLYREENGLTAFHHKNFACQIIFRRVADMHKLH